MNQKSGTPTKFFEFVRYRWLTVYPTAVLVAFVLGFLLKDQVTKTSSRLPAVLLTLPWSVFPVHVLPEPLPAFLNSFYGLPLVLAAMTVNIAFIGLILWVKSGWPAH